MRKLFISVLLTVSLLGCGSKNPFDRGATEKGNASGGSGAGGESKPTNKLDKIFFETTVKKVIEENCTGCHGDTRATFEDASKHVVPGKPEESELVQRALGQLGHSAILENPSAELTVLKDWINGSKVSSPQ